VICNFVSLSFIERCDLKLLILALESSAKPVSVAVYEVSGVTSSAAPDDPPDTEISGKLLGQSFQNNGFSHSRTLLAMTEALLKILEIKPSDLGLIAVSKGPGSFTGVRIGVAAVKGLAWGLDIPVCGVSTLEAMAYQTQETGVIICPVMDARREQVYNALFEWRDGVLIRLCDDRAISLEDLASELQGYDSPVLLVGDGVDVCKENEAFAECRTTPELMRYQTAYGVALAAANKKTIPAVELEPFYLRPSQAEREASARLPIPPATPPTDF